MINKGVDDPLSRRMAPFALLSPFSAEISIRHVHQAPFVGDSTQFYVQMVLRQREDVLACLRFTGPDDKPTCCVIHHKTPLASTLAAVSELHAGQVESLFQQKPVASLQK